MGEENGSLVIIILEMLRREDEKFQANLTLEQYSVSRTK